MWQVCKVPNKSKSDIESTSKQWTAIVPVIQIALIQYFSKELVLFVSQVQLLFIVLKWILYQIWIYLGVFIKARTTYGVVHWQPPCSSSCLKSLLILSTKYQPLWKLSDLIKDFLSHDVLISSSPIWDMIHISKMIIVSKKKA